MLPTARTYSFILGNGGYCEQDADKDALPFKFLFTFY